MNKTLLTAQIIWVSQDKLQHFLWSRLLFWVYLVVKRKAYVSFVIKLSEERIWLTEIQNQTEKWSKLKIHKDNNEYVSTLVHSKMSGTEEPFGKSHRSCDRKLHSRFNLDSILHKQCREYKHLERKIPLKKAKFYQ